MKNNSISIFEIDEDLVLFSDSIKKLLIPDFDNYGLGIEQFLVTNILKPDGESYYEKFKEFFLVKKKSLLFYLMTY